MILNDKIKNVLAIAFYDGFSNCFRCFWGHGLKSILMNMLKVYNTGIQTIL